MSSESHRVVVTGLGVVAPNAIGTAPFARALREGKSGIRFFQYLADTGFACQVGGIPEGVDELAPSYFSSDELFAMNGNMIYAGMAAIDAWKDSGLDRRSLDMEPDWDTGAVIGTGIGGMDTIAEKLVPRTDAGKVSRLGSSMVEQIMASGNTARIAGLLGLGNQVTTNSSACTTGTEAVVMAYSRLKRGEAKRMLAGGSEGHSKYIWAGFDAMKVLNRTSNHAPLQASRPLSASAAGFVPGSGSGVLMLETLESAQARGARIYAEILSGAVNCGGHRNGGSMTAPNPESVRRCIKQALQLAGISGSDISAINGHLTATMADPLEVRNWSLALELPPAKMPKIQSTKSLIGHALGAAGGIECVASVLQLSQGFLHASANCEDLHSELTEFGPAIVQKTLELDLNIIAKASFGFGDVNGCVIFKKFTA